MIIKISFNVKQENMSVISVYPNSILPNINANIWDYFSFSTEIQRFISKSINNDPNWGLHKSTRKYKTNVNTNVGSMQIRHLPDLSKYKM